VRNVDAILRGAGLVPMLRVLPHGLQTAVGENGALISGGEGQRVRFGRALLRPGVRLAVLDEPFRGLSRADRRDLLNVARTGWRRATLLFISHDISETLAFDRVLVLDRGRVVEDGAPSQLAARPDSRYARMLAAEVAAERRLHQVPGLRIVELDDGRAVERRAGADLGHAPSRPDTMSSR
jgi:ATP-binding cassette subfamily B protein